MRSIILYQFTSAFINRFGVVPFCKTMTLGRPSYRNTLDKFRYTTPVLTGIWEHVSTAVQQFQLLWVGLFFWKPSATTPRNCQHLMAHFEARPAFTSLKVSLRKWQVSANLPSSQRLPIFLGQWDDSAGFGTVRLFGAEFFIHVDEYNETSK